MKFIPALRHERYQRTHSWSCCLPPSSTAKSQLLYLYQQMLSFGEEHFGRIQARRYRLRNLDDHRIGHGACEWWLTTSFLLTMKSTKMTQTTR